LIDAAALIRLVHSILACTGLSSLARDPAVAAGGLTIVALDGGVFYEHYIPPRAKLLRVGAMERAPLPAPAMRFPLLVGMPPSSLRSAASRK
jgi:hypothetical protein